MENGFGKLYSNFARKNSCSVSFNDLEKTINRKQDIWVCLRNSVGTSVNDNFSHKNRISNYFRVWSKHILPLAKIMKLAHIEEHLFDTIQMKYIKLIAWRKQVNFLKHSGYSIIYRTQKDCNHYANKQAFRVHWNPRYFFHSIIKNTFIILKNFVVSSFLMSLILAVCWNEIELRTGYWYEFI